LTLAKKICYNTLNTREREKKMFEVGDTVRLGGISGKIVGWYFDEGDVWIVDLCGVRCECSTNELVNGLPPHEWERACGA
jgi:uncharacterized protein YcgI (DUF1989 family)